MHIALLSPSWPSGSYPNGIVTYVHWMHAELLRRGHRVSILTNAEAESEEGVFTVREAPVMGIVRDAFERLSRRRHGLGDRAGKAIADTVLSLHRHSPVDVIEMEESFGWAATVAKRTGIPTVVKLHGPAFLSLVDEELETPFAAQKIAAEGFALSELPIWTSPARDTLDKTLRHYRATPRVARHIVNPLELPASVPLWQFEQCDPKTILFVGRFDKRKGGDTVLKAFANLLPRNPDLKLIFVGPDFGVPDKAGRRRHFQEMAAELLPGAAPDQLQYLGKLSPEEIYPLRTRAMLTIIASLWENQSYTALEAMLQGCPIVSSDAGGQGEIIEGGVSGLLVKAGDAVALACGIQTLLDDPNCAAALGRSARAHALQKHSSALVVGETLEVYRQAIDEARSRPR